MEPRNYTVKYILSPGPTEIPHRIRSALSIETTNPDLDPLFHEEFFLVHQKLSRIIGGWHAKIFTLLGAPSLALEASITNFVKKGEKAIVLSNGYFGDLFIRLIKEYERVPVVYRWNERKGLEPEKAIEFINEHPDAKAVYLVHCETPTGIINDIRRIGEFLKTSDMIYIVDSVSTIGAVPIMMDDWGIDVLIGAGHKALNLPPGITIMALSRRAWKRVHEIKPKGFYMNLLLWKDFFERMGEAPYTLSQPLLKALETSLDLIIEEDENSVFQRHVKAKEASFKAAEALGLEPFPEGIEYASPTVTALLTPDSLSASEIFTIAWERYGVMFGMGLGSKKEKIIRIGHMGVTASRHYLLIAYSTLGKILLKKGYIQKKDIDEALSIIEERFQ